MNPKKILSLLISLLYVLSPPLFAFEQRPEEANRSAPMSRTVSRPISFPTRSSRPASTPLKNWTGARPVQINLGRPSNNSISRPSNPPQNVRPSMGTSNLQASGRPSAPNRPGGLSVNPSIAQTGNRVHHHAYTPGYVRQKLKKIGVASIPMPLTDRTQMLDLTRQQSSIRLPKMGPDKQPLSSTAISPRDYNNEIVRDHMALIDSDSWAQQADHLDQTENQSGHYYWHKDNGFNYCHYQDGQGNHWWGWYAGNNYFWTLNHGDHWWIYDSDFGRWCFFSDGWWWWQDPYHVGDLYLYDDGDYIACNSTNDEVVVSTMDQPNSAVYTSPDGTRVVKVMGDTQDTFLYDTAVPPSFNPIYLASKVTNVSFSNTDSGRPLQILLTLSDGSFDIVDDQGNLYESPGTTPAN